MDREEDIMYYDFQGWPVYKKTLKEVLEELGATTENGVIGFSINSPILNIYPVVLRDDGMAYGVDPRYITEAYFDDENGYINIFAERKVETDEPSVPQQLQELGELFSEQIETIKKEKEND